jgi:hypothetical protein
MTRSFNGYPLPTLLIGGGPLFGEANSYENSS